MHRLNIVLPPKKKNSNGTAGKREEENSSEGTRTGWSRWYAAESNHHYPPKTPLTKAKSHV
jgi:hypothetical protein